MSKANRYSPEARERAVRMVLEHQGDYPSQWQAICSVAGKIGCSPDSLKTWLSRSQAVEGQHGGATHKPHERLKALEKENRELRRVNDILKPASAFFLPRRRSTAD
ncbi:MAG: transposase [Chromatiales bacterium]|jgi:transposase|nr:transposase [Chromatiales bacterium]